MTVRPKGGTEAELRCGKIAKASACFEYLFIY